MQKSFFDWVTLLVGKYGGMFIQGAGVTLMIALVGTISGFVIGLGVAIARTAELSPQSGRLPRALLKAVKGLLTAYIEIFRGTPMAQWHWLLIFGVIVGIGAQAGDLMLSSIKRDIGIKDMGTILPGHGGVLDRFNSLLLVAPAAFHFIRFFVGVAEQQPARLITGG